MDFITNPFVIAIICGLFAFGVTFIYLKKTTEEEEFNKSNCLKVGLLSALSVLFSSGYLKYAYEQTEAETLTTEFFQVGQPQF